MSETDSTFEKIIALPAGDYRLGQLAETLGVPLLGQADNVRFGRRICALAGMRKGAKFVAVIGQGRHRVYRIIEEC